MIKIDRDGSAGTGDDRYKVTVSDKGFGSWRVKGLTIGAALETVKHYYGYNHDANLCGHCRNRGSKKVEAA